MHTGIADRYMDFGVAKVADKALTAGIKKRFGILGFGPSLENFLVVENNSAIGRGQIITLFLFFRSFVLYFLLVLCL